MDTDPDTAVKQKNQTLKREKKYVVSIGKLFSLLYRFQNTYESNETHHLEKFQVKILV
jgi:hypothetical protein